MNGEDHRVQSGLESPWLLRLSPNPRARLRLFCLPHAGGDTWIFRDWQRALPAFVEVCAIRLPGRGSRHAEPPVTEFEPLVGALGAALDAALDLPFAIFGNSMGALVAFEAMRHLERAGRVDARMLCVAAARAPQLAYFPTISTLPPRQILEAMQRRYGTPMGDIALSDELMDLAMPIMRADLELCETYRYRDGPRLASPITAYCGNRDTTLDAASVEAWASQTKSAFARHEIIGDHFFAVGSKAALLRLLAQDLEWAMA